MKHHTATHDYSTVQCRAAKVLCEECLRRVAFAQTRRRVLDTSQWHKKLVGDKGN